MRRMLVLMFVLALAVGAAAALVNAPDAGAQGPPRQGGPGGPPREPGGPGGPGGPRRPFEWNQARAETLVMNMLERIKGKEDMPAESVYKNIKILNGMPARRLPGIMAMGFSRSVGMGCGGCHVRDDFASDDKASKRVARDMWAMTMDINKKYLTQMKDLDTELPTINCWSCHRGRRVPEINADARPDSADRDHGDHDHDHPQPEPSH